MEFPGFLPKPQAVLEGLSIELCIQISLATSASGDFIIDATSALNLSIANKTMYDKSTMASCNAWPRVPSSV
jgi:hypothetical protein